MRTLLVGDPHVRVEDLEECDQLLLAIRNTAVQRQCERVLFMGDLFHTHAVIRVEVLDFWQRAFRMLMDAGLKVTTLVGNHDAPGDGGLAVHSLQAFEFDNLTIVDKPMVEHGKHLYLPYVHDPAEFVRLCNEYSHCDTVFCHQEFNGCQYENGFYSKHGVDPESIPQRWVISGHIHKAQNFGKVKYPGSPRWMTASDANEGKFIYVVERQGHGPGGWILDALGTDAICTPILAYEDTEENHLKSVVPEMNCRRIVNIRGSAAWIEERRAFWAGIPNTRIRTFCTDSKVTGVRESDGISVAFKKYFDAWQAPRSSEKETLAALVAERLPGFKWS